MWGRGMLSGSGAVRPGVRAPGPLSLLGGLGVVGGLVVNCIVDASIKNVFLLLFWFAAPLGPSFVLPVRSLVGGVGVGGRVCAARHRVGWAGPSAVRAPVSDVRFVVVCCVLFVDF